MADEGFKRKLAAILSADVEGYSRLMDDDEEATVRTLTAYRSAINDLVQQYRGRVVDTPGDNILAEFTSVVDSVNCAVEIQRELAERNVELPYNRKMEFRIGVNLGDVIEEEDRIYGDGVNIAARVEGLTEAGGICISGRVYDQVENKLDLEYEFLGEQMVKNIATPLRIYRVLSHPGAAAHRVIKAKRAVGRTWRNILVATVAFVVVGASVAVWHFYLRAPVVEVASVEKMALPLPDRPSIAVLPFDNMSEDPEQEYFSDGLSDQIISSLSKIPYLFVIARNSTFTYKGKPVKIQKVAEDLGVRYVLEGSVQRSADRVRITAQLVDAITGRHQWSERYDRDLADIFAIQDDIAMAITKALNIELIEGEQARLHEKGTTTNLKAYLKYLEGMSYYHRLTKEDNTRARQLFEEALAIDPDYANAYVLLGTTHWYDARYGWVESRDKSIATAYKYAQKALELDDTLDTAHLVIGVIYLLKRQHEKNIAQGKLALALNPNGAWNHMFLAGALGCAGRWEESLGYAEKAMRLSPFPTVAYYWLLGRSYFMTGQYDKAIETFKTAVHVNPDYLVAHAFLAACYSSLDRQVEAKTEASEVLRINPQFNIKSYSKTLPYKNKADIERYVAALRKAGLPNTPPLPLPEKPSIAVLPFVNISEDPKQEYFSDGLTEEIITTLSKNPRLFVIARNSVFTYKGTPVKVQQVSKDLGVRYVLEGSVRKAGNRVRITAQLIDATSGNHVWSERYDRSLEDIFAIQDDITLEIMKAMHVKLLDGEQVRHWHKHGTTNLQAYEKVLRARGYAYGTRESIFRVRQLYEEAIVLDPGYARAHAMLGWNHFIEARLGWSKSPAESFKIAFEYGQKAIALDDTLDWSHMLLASVYLVKRQFEKAVANAERAVALNPGGADAYACLSGIIGCSGRWEESVFFGKKSIRLNPAPTVYFYHWLGRAYFMTGQYDEAIDTWKKALNLSPDYLNAHTFLVACYSSLDRQAEAAAAAKEVLRINPKFSLESYAKRLPYRNKTDIDRYVAALKKAGLPE
jgi:adenylate cyclase